MARLVFTTPIRFSPCLAPLLAACLISLAGCGGNDTPTAGAVGFSLAGAGQKGPYLAGGAVNAYKLNAAVTRTATRRTATTDADGKYQIAGIDWTGLTEIAVSGRYYDEAADADSPGTLELIALVDAQGAATARVNLFTHLLAGRIRVLMAAGGGHAEARTQALTELATRFGLDLAGGIGPESLDLTDGAGPNRRDNANLLLLSAALLAAGMDSQTGLDALRDDFADNGVIDAAGWNTVRRAAGRQNLDTLRTRLMARSVAFTDPPATDDQPPHSAWVLAEQLPDTGIRADQCYAAGSDALVDCTGAAAIALNDRQDGMITPGGEGLSYSLVAKAGGGTYDKTECVRDDITGLVWEGKTTSGERGGANVYTNYDDVGQAQKQNGTTWVNPTQAEIDAAGNSRGYVAYVNGLALCGYTDWRLPTADELQLLVDYGVALPGPTIEAVWFPNTPAESSYWTSSPYVDDTRSAWYVGFVSGYVNLDFRNNDNQVRLVRASQ